MGWRGRGGREQFSPSAPAALRRAACPEPRCGVSGRGESLHPQTFLALPAPWHSAAGNHRYRSEMKTLFPRFLLLSKAAFPLKKKKSFGCGWLLKKNAFFFLLFFFSPFKTHRFESNASGNIEVPHTMIALRSPGLSARVSRTRSGCVQSPAEIR